MKRRTRRSFAVLILTAACFVGLAPGQPAQQSRKGLIVSGNARFQFLTPSLVRMEYAPHGVFVDAPTAIVLKRDWPSVEVRVEEKGDSLIATTAVLTLRYRADPGGFTPANLHISWKDGTRERTWSPGDVDIENLGGIAHSLDGARKGRIPDPGTGILSRSGYFVLDDSPTPVWDSVAKWITPRTGTGQRDLYVMVYGRQYAQALKEYASLCGSIPMVPRYVLGGWITDLNYEYLPGHDIVEKYHYSDRDVRAIVERFKTEQIPLDVLVLDFAWHRFGWAGGYDWSPIFPHPREFLSWMHSQGLRVTVNDHPGYGGESTLSDSDSHASEVRRLLGLDMPRPAMLSVNLERGWKFHLDPTATGIAGRWFAADIADDDWKTLEAGRSWEDQGFPDYDGFAWYRKWFDVPATLPPGPLFLAFGGVDDEYDLYVNGQKVAHHGSPGSSIYGSMTSTEVSSLLHPGEKNLVVVRVNDWGGEGGLTKAPVVLTDVVPAGGIRFNLADKRQADVFMNVLHNPVIDQGVDFWWIDGGSGSCSMEGLNSQLWTNRVFYQSTQEHTGKRTFVFSRYGGWGDHRSPGLFTGDTHSEWDVLAAEVPFTERGGNVLVPYITHDIGGFLGKKLDFDLYARWLEFGVFSPILRLHCAYENPEDGNLRLPWIYGEKGTRLAREMFQLRYRLLPYIYTYSRVAHDDALPLVRPLYLEHPDLPEAYDHPDEYYFGSELLVAPVVTENDTRDVYLPPGSWIDFNGGEKYEGGKTISVRVPLDQVPVFVRSGSIVPMGRALAHAGDPTGDSLVVEIYGTGKGSFRLYEDDGVSLDERSGNSAWTELTSGSDGKNGHRVVIGPTSGEFSGQSAVRALTARFHGFEKPTLVRASADGHPLAGVISSWDEQSRTVLVTLPAQGIRSRVEIVLE